MFALCVFFIGFGKLSAEQNLFLEFRGRTDKKKNKHTPKFTTASKFKSQLQHFFFLNMFLKLRLKKQFFKKDFPL